MTVAPMYADDDLELSFDGGRVTVVATEVPLPTILDAWSRLGNTRFVDAERVSGQAISVEMIDVPEREALRVLLRAVGGYVAAPRAVAQPGTSAYDRVLIMATSRRLPRRAPAYASSPFGSATGRTKPQPNPLNEAAPPGVVAEPDDPSLDQLELLEQLRGQAQSAPPPDLFSQPAFFRANQSSTQGDGAIQTAPRPGMITSSPNPRERPGRRPATPVRPQTDDP